MKAFLKSFYQFHSGNYSYNYISYPFHLELSYFIL